MIPNPEAIYCDGGMIGTNPSKVGGTWAYCWVNGGVVVRSKSGVVTAKEIGQDVTNNYTELLAAYLALSSVPNDWRGTIYTDSLVTFYRLCKSKSFLGIPEEFKANVLRRRKKGKYNVTLLKGHPTDLDLSRGRTSTGVLVSPHNVLCDTLCGREAAKFLKARKAV